MRIEVDELNKILTTEKVIKVVESLGGVIANESSYGNDGEEYMIWSSICHHKSADSHKKKLYMKISNNTFYCYSCSNSFNLYTLIIARKELLGEECNFPQALQYVCDVCDIPYDKTSIEPTKVKKKEEIFDWMNVLGKYIKNSNRNTENKIYDKSVLKLLDKIYHDSFISDNIPIEVQEKYGIRFYKYGQSICIPIYDEDANFIGVHCRQLLPHIVDAGFKYLPLKILNGTEYNFSTNNVLYGLNVNKINIQNKKTAILVESPKSVMQLETILPMNISCALFGMNCSKVKRDILLKMGVTHIVIALDKQYHNAYETNENGERVKTQEFEKYEKTIFKIRDLFVGFCSVYVMYDDINLLNYKDSPSDRGKETWDRMYNEKECIYEVS